MGWGRKWTDAQVEKVVNLAAEGHSWYEIAKLVKRSFSSVKTLLRRASKGLLGRKLGRKPKATPRDLQPYLASLAECPKQNLKQLTRTVVAAGGKAIPYGTLHRMVRASRSPRKIETMHVTPQDPRRLCFLDEKWFPFRPRPNAAGHHSPACEWCLRPLALYPF